MNKGISRMLRGLGAAFCLAGAAQAGETVSSVAIVNDTGRAFTDLFLSPSSSSQWGPDMLDALLADDETYSLINIPCDQYDLMIVEASGDECLLPAIPLCGSDEVWKFSEETWRACVSMNAVAAAPPR